MPGDLPSRRAPAAPAARFELALLAVSTVVWLLAVLGLFGLLPLAGLAPLDLYRFYSMAGLLGWTSGNVYVLRRRGLPTGLWRKRLLLAYLLGPSSAVYLLRALAPVVDQRAAPLAAVYGFCVYGLFFLVPVTLKGSATLKGSRPDE